MHARTHARTHTHTHIVQRPTTHTALGTVGGSSVGNERVVGGKEKEREVGRRERERWEGMREIERE